MDQFENVTTNEGGNDKNGQAKQIQQLEGARKIFADLFRRSIACRFWS